MRSGHKVDPSPKLRKRLQNLGSSNTVVGAASQGTLKSVGKECMVFIDGT